MNLFGHSGRCRSCSSRSKGKGKQKHFGFEEISGSFWGKIVRNAKRRDIEVDITAAIAWDIFIKQNRKCALTGKLLVFSKTKKEFVNQTASLDRIDSSKGYIKNNIQWVHKDINRMKQSYPQDYFIEMCGLVHNYAQINYSRI